MLLWGAIAALGIEKSKLARLNQWDPSAGDQGGGVMVSKLGFWMFPVAQTRPQRIHTCNPWGSFLGSTSSIGVPASSIYPGFVLCDWGMSLTNQHANLRFSIT